MRTGSFDPARLFCNVSVVNCLRSGGDFVVGVKSFEFFCERFALGGANDYLIQNVVRICWGLGNVQLPHVVGFTVVEFAYVVCFPSGDFSGVNGKRRGRSYAAFDVSLKVLETVADGWLVSDRNPGSDAVLVLNVVRILHVNVGTRSRIEFACSSLRYLPENLGYGDGGKSAHYDNDSHELYERETFIIGAKIHNQSRGF